MKKAILVSLFATIVCCNANASDGGVYVDTETYTQHVSINAEHTEYNAVKPTRTFIAQPVSRPCTHASVTNTPVRVKTYTEVIDHYQVYQPVTIYQPVGAYAQRRVIESARPCGCGK